MNWNDPKARHDLLQSVGHDEYHRLQAKHFKDTTTATIGGHDIRPVQNRFGRLFLVGKTKRAFSTLAEAESFATKNPTSSVAAAAT